MKISIDFPYVMYFDDYHEIDDFVDKFNELTKGKPKLKFTEILHHDSDYGYAALFYIGKQNTAYKKMLKAFQKNLEKEEDYES